MTALASDDIATEWAKRLVKTEQDRTGLDKPMARRNVARRLQAPPGTLENLIRGRLKGVRLCLFEKLKAAVVTEIRREIEAHEHELLALAQDPRGNADGSITEAQAGLVRLKARLREAEPLK